MIKVSAIVYIDDDKEKVTNCIDSILGQSLRDIEIICYYNGTNENIINKLNLYLNEDHRFKCIFDTSLGCSSAWNDGLEKSLGEYILFFKTNIVVSSTLFEKCYCNIKYKNSDIAIFVNYSIENLDNKIYVDKNSLNMSIINNIETVFSYKTMPNSICNFTSSNVYNKFYRRDFIISNDLQFQKVKYFYELCFVLYSLLIAHGITCIHEPLVSIFDKKMEKIKNKKNEVLCLKQAAEQLISKSQQLLFYHDVRESIAYAIITEYLKILKKKKSQSIYHKICGYILLHIKIFASSHSMVCAGQFLVNFFIKIDSIFFNFIRFNNKLLKSKKSKLNIEVYNDIHNFFNEDYFKHINFENIEKNTTIRKYNKILKYDYDHMIYKKIVATLFLFPRLIFILSKKIRLKNIHDDSETNNEIDLNGTDELLKFYTSPSSHFSILVMEINDCHGEVIPGYIKYFLDMGFFVDVIMTINQFKQNPLARIHSDKMRIFALDINSMKIILSSDKIKKYECVFFTSYRLYYWMSGNHMPTIYEFQKKIMNNKIFAVEHHIDKINMDMFEKKQIVTLSEFSLPNNKKTMEVNPHYFGEVVITPKNKKVTHFIIVGALEAGRRNCQILLRAARDLIAEGIKNFKITVIGRGILSVPDDLAPYFSIMGKVDYPTLYRCMEESDFFLTLLDPDNQNHDRYLHYGTSGSFQLVYGFQKPCLIVDKFAEKYSFNIDNSIIYLSNDELAQALKLAVRIDDNEYLLLQNNLKITAHNIYMKSFHTLNFLIGETRHGN